MKVSGGVRKAVLTLVVIVMGTSIGVSIGLWWTYSTHQSAPAVQKGSSLLPQPAMQSAPQIQAEPKVAEWTPEDEVLAGIKMNMSPQEVLAVLGEPQTKVQETEPNTAFPGNVLYYDTWAYPGLEVTFLDFGPEGEENHQWKWVVLSVKVTGNDYTTHRGIRVGDPIEKVIEVYGQSIQRGYYRYNACSQYTSEFDDTLNFEVQNGAVSSFKVYAIWE